MASTEHQCWQGALFITKDRTTLARRLQSSYNYVLSALLLYGGRRNARPTQSETDLVCLPHVFIRRINEHLPEFSAAWNQPMSTEGGRSPRQLVLGMTLGLGLDRTACQEWYESSSDSQSDFDVSLIYFCSLFIFPPLKGFQQNCRLVCDKSILCHNRIITV